MMRLTISAVAIVALGIGLITLRSPSSSVEISAGAAAMPSLQDLHAAVGVDKLPVQEIDDQSLVSTATTKPKLS